MKYLAGIVVHVALIAMIGYLFLLQHKQNDTLQEDYTRLLRCVHTETVVRGCIDENRQQ